MTRGNQGNRAQAFTLTELLIVIGILALLAAVLLPVFFAARKKAHTTQCVSNLRQIGIALQSYVSDYDSVYPPDSQALYTGGKSGKININNTAHWCDLLTAYTAGSFPVCPDRVIPPSWAKDFKGKPKVSGYTFNVNLSQAVTVSEDKKTSAGIREGVVKNPSLLVAVFDARVFLISSNEPDTLDKDDPAEEGPPGATRHQNGANYLFADGHVQWFLPNALATGEKSDGTHPGFGL